MSDFDLSPSIEDLPIIPNADRDKLMDEAVNIPGRTLVIIEHPGQEFTDFLPVFDNVDRDRCKVLLINLTDAPLIAWQQAMRGLAVCEWDAWCYRTPPPALTGVLRRLIDLLEQWDPHAVFAPANSLAPAALARLRPHLHTPAVPRLFLSYETGFTQDAVSLTMGNERYTAWSSLHRHCYQQTTPLKSVQTYVEHSDDR